MVYGGTGSGNMYVSLYVVLTRVAKVAEVAWFRGVM